MALVTLCIPAYRSERHIAPLLEAIQAQTFGDFQVEIGLEPVDPEPTIRACERFLADPRFRLVINASQLGWDGNVRALLRRVRTPLFTVQPHDDVLSTRYLATLIAALDEHPEASTAYADAYLFGPQAGRRGTTLASGSIGRQLLAFHLDGAQGHLGRGVSRQRVLDVEFPENPEAGFSVETVFAQHLIVRGPVVHVPEVLYFRRASASQSGTVTGAWRRADQEHLWRAVEHNRAGLMGGIPDEVPGDVARQTLVLACEAAMLRRWTTYARGRFGLVEEQLRRAAMVLRTPIDDPAAPLIRARVHVALSMHHSALGAAAEARREAEKAVRDAPDDWESLLTLARLLPPDEVLDMAALVERAIARGPVDPVARSAMERVDRLMIERYGSA